MIVLRRLHLTIILIVNDIYDKDCNELWHFWLSRKFNIRILSCYHNRDIFLAILKFYTQTILKLLHID